MIIATFTRCDVCGREGIPQAKRNSRITVRLESKGQLYISRPLDLCEFCLARLTRAAKGEANDGES